MPTRIENAHKVRKKTFVFIITGKREHLRAFSNRYAYSSGVTRGLSLGGYRLVTSLVYNFIFLNNFSLDLGLPT